MVRTLVGTMLERDSPTSSPRSSRGARDGAGSTAPARGLYLDRRLLRRSRWLRSAACASRSSSSTSTAPSSTPARSSSPRCGTRRETVLGARFSDEELMASVGGPGLEAQMGALGPDRVDELVRVYRAHNEPLHDELEALAGIEDVLAELQGRGPPARHRHRQAARRPSSSRSRGCRSGTSSTSSSAATRPSGTSRIPAPLLLALERLGASAERGRVRRRLAVRHAGGEGRRALRGRRHLGRASTTATRSADADVVVDTAEELLAVL